MPAAPRRRCFPTSRPQAGTTTSSGWHAGGVLEKTRSPRGAYRTLQAAWQASRRTVPVEFIESARRPARVQPWGWTTIPAVPAGTHRRRFVVTPSDGRRRYPLSCSANP